MKHSCKLCGGPVEKRHTIQDIDYYYCPACSFLQNYYWEGKNAPAYELTEVNRVLRNTRWPAGEEKHMRDKGWEMLELMYWPPAWFSRIAHTLLKRLPGYTRFVHWWIKRKSLRVLDFGCGFGITVLELRAHDAIDISGLDPYSPTTSPHIERRQLHEANVPDNFYDGIFTIETMEHISNVVDTFTLLQRMLKPGGVLLIQTRRLEDPEYKDQGAGWFYLREPKAHVSIYSAPAVREIARRAGFRAVRLRGVRLAKFIK